MIEETFIFTEKSRQPKLEQSEIRLKREEKFRSEYKQLDIGEGLSQEGFETLLTDIDFGSLKKLLGQVIEKSGISADKMNFLEADNIYQIKSSATGMFFIQGNIIGLGSHFKDEAERMMKKYDMDAPKYETLLKLEMLSTLIHEEIHAISRNKLEEWNEDIVARDDFRKNNASSGVYTQYQSGYQGGQWVSSAFDKSRSDLEPFFAAFDEGVTQKLSTEIFNSYLNNDNSINPEELKKYFQIQKSESQEFGQSGRDKVVRLVDLIIDKIAEHAKLDKKIVWQAIVRGKMQGDDLQEVELKDFINKATIGDFMKELKSAIQLADINDCIRRLNSDSE